MIFNNRDCSSKYKKNDFHSYDLLEKYAHDREWTIMLLLQLFFTQCANLLE